MTGDPAWMDSILYEWVGSPTESDLEQGKNNVSLLLGKMISVTNEVARENLEDNEALDLLTELVPPFFTRMKRKNSIFNKFKLFIVVCKSQ